MLKQKVFKICIVFILLSGCAIVPISERRQLSLVPQAQLLSLSEDNYQQILNQSTISANAKKTQMVVDVGKKIAASAEEFLRENGLEQEIKNYNWKFNLVEDDTTINAFCMPGGKVVVYTGILPIAQDENGLAVIMGHEVAHAIANHGGERMTHLLLVQLGGKTLSEALKNSPEKTTQLLMTAYGVGSNLGFILPYSRVHEREADRIGLIIMARAAYDPRTAIPFWQRMSKQEGKMFPEFLSTHPTTERRIEEIRSLIPEALTYYKK